MTPGLTHHLRPERFYRRYRVALHVAFWLSIITYDVLVWGLVDAQYMQKLVSTLSELPVKMAAAYFTLYVLIDRLFLEKKYAQFLIGLVVSMFAIGLILRCLSYFILYPIYYPTGVSIPLLFPPKILIAIFYTYSWVAMLAAIHLVRKFYEHQHETSRLLLSARQLEKEKLEAELKLLKSQIHPHFLFNTLNNLYALTLKDASKAPVMVHKLSELMSYMLHDSNQLFVPLYKEVNYIQNYIDLERLRYGRELEVTFSNFVGDNSIQVAPLLMLPFVENGFKHGNKYGQAWIHVELSLTEDELTFKMENNKPEIPDGVVSGVGLENVTRRLAVQYPDQHDLRIFDTPDTYLVILRLSISGKPISKRIVEEVD